MAVAKAEARYIKVAPRKVRQVLDLVRDKEVVLAQNILLNLNKKSAYVVNKILKSAVANAENNKGLKKEDLYISKTFAAGGPMLKRHQAASMGRAVLLRRRSSHIVLELDLKNKNKVLKTPAKGGKK